MAGLVECNGMFWVEGLPLSGGTNWVTLTATDAAMNTTVTNLAVIQSGLVLTMNPVDGGALLKGRVTVTGTVGDAGYAVWVNGVPATVNPDGTWSAANVPVVGSGTASFYINAYPPGEHPPVPDPPPPEAPAANPPSARAPGLVPDVEQRAHVRMRYYFELTSCFWVLGGWGCGMLWSPRGAHGFEGYTYGDWGHSLDYAWPEEEYVVWDAEANSTWGLNRLGTATYHWWSGLFSGEEQRAGVGAPRTAPSAPSYLYKPMVIAEDCYLRDLTDYDEYRRFAGAQLQFRTGGKALPRRRNLYQVLATASHITNPRWRLELPVPFDGVPAWRLQVGALGTPGNDSRLWRVLPDNAVYDVTVGVRGVCDTNHFFTYAVQPTKHKARILATGGGNAVTLEPDRMTPSAEFCVGHKLVFSLELTPSLPGGALQSEQCAYQWLLPPEYRNAWEEFEPSDENPLEGNYYFNMCHPPLQVWSRTAGSEGLPEPPYCKRYLERDWPLRQPETGAWWISGGPKHITAYADLVFANGQRVTVRERGRLEVFKPTVAPYRQPNGLWYHDPRSAVFNDTGGSTSLMLADKDMGFDICINTTSQFSGRAGFVQLVEYEEAAPPLLSNTDGEFRLDSSYPYGGIWRSLPEAAYLSFSDGPETIGSVGLEWCGWNTISTTKEFKTYVLFKPETGGFSQNIDVPLAVVTWLWSATAEKRDGVWIKLTDVCPVPSFTESNEFPEWLRVESGQPGD